MEKVEINNQYYLKKDVEDIGHYLRHLFSSHLFSIVLRKNEMSDYEYGLDLIKNNSDLMLTYDEQVKFGLEIYIDKNIEYSGASARQNINCQDVSNLTGIEFEQYCCNILRSKGYSVETTKITGDQGVDIIAISTDGKKIAIQCKRYSSPVGNASVQEIYSGMKFYNADEAWVLTNSSFTKSAKELAERTGVKLIDGHSLDKMPGRTIKGSLATSADVLKLMSKYTKEDFDNRALQYRYRVTKVPSSIQEQKKIVKEIRDSLACDAHECEYYYNRYTL